jgi:hypothetical protein
MISYSHGATPEPGFSLGQVVATPGCLAKISQDEIAEALSRHEHGDWGELDPDDRHINDVALRQGGRIFSAYASRAGIKFWIITEADRSVTTILLPSEY